MLEVIFLFEDANSLIHGDPRLDDARVGRGRDDALRLDGLHHARRHVIREDLDLILKAALLEDLHRSFGCRSRPDDIRKIGMSFQRAFDELQLNLFAGVSVLGLDDLNVTGFDGIDKAEIARLHPSGSGGAWKPPNLATPEPLGCALVR